MYMERVLSVEEKIRRAEEIYNKRNGGDVSTYSTKENNKPSLIHRLIKQIIVCFLIYGVFYVVSNRDYFLSQEFRDKAEKVTSQNEMLHNSYNFVMSYVDKYIGNKTEENLNTENIEEKQEEIKEKNEQQQDNADDKKGGLAKVIAYVSKHPEINAVGGWFNKDNNQYYFDATIIVDDLSAAVALGRANNQIAIFNLDTLEEIRL